MKMVAVEASAAWQHTTNRCLVQEDMKTGPKQQNRIIYLLYVNLDLAINEIQLYMNINVFRPVDLTFDLGLLSGLKHATI